jgi:hypothetical protein
MLLEIEASVLAQVRASQHIQERTRPDRVVDHGEGFRHCSVNRSH